MALLDHWRSRSTSWSFPPPDMQPIPRWQSAGGLACLGIVAAWWAAIPYAPGLVLGSAAGRLSLGPAWDVFYGFASGTPRILRGGGASGLLA